MNYSQALITETPVPSEIEAEEEEHNEENGCHKDKSVLLYMPTTTPERNFVLMVLIEETKDVDRMSTMIYLNSMPVLYYAACWVDPMKIYRTEIVPGSLRHLWKAMLRIPMGDYPPDYDFLYFEIIRLCFVTEPGTSTGLTVVARVKVPLTKKLFQGRIVSGFYGMVALDEDDGLPKPQGFVGLSMQIKVIRPVPSYYSDDE